MWTNVNQYADVNRYEPTWTDMSRCEPMWTDENGNRWKQNNVKFPFLTGKIRFSPKLSTLEKGRLFLVWGGLTPPPPMIGDKSPKK